MPIKQIYNIYLDIAIQSVLKQSSSKWQLFIVVEKETPGNNLDTIYRYKDNRIKIFFNKGKGLAGAVNTAMRTINNEFVALLLGDDYLGDNSVAVLLSNIINNQNVDFFHSSIRFVDDKGKYISGVYRSKEFFEIKDFWRTSPPNHLLCWRRKFALKIGGIDESLGDGCGCDDYDFPWSMAEAGAKFKNIRECLYFYRDHRNFEGERITTHCPLDMRILSIEKMFRKHRVPDKETKDFIQNAKQGFLKQCLFLDQNDKNNKLLGKRPTLPFWREEYIAIDKEE